MRTADSHDTDLVAWPAVVTGPDMRAALRALRATPDVVDSDMLDTLHKLIERLTQHYVVGRLGDLTPRVWQADMPADLRLAADLYERYGVLLIQARDGTTREASG